MEIKSQEKESLIRQLQLMEELTLYVVIDNHTIDNNPNLKDKAKNIYNAINDLKNHIV